MESLSLLSQAALQMVKFGPVLNIRIARFSLAALPQGLVAAGAACSATTVDSDDALGQAKVTAILVRLGYVEFVRDIVVRLCEKEDRSDVVAAITAKLLELKELEIVTQINNSLVAGGHIATGAKIAGSMVSQGYTEMGEIASQQITGSQEGGLLQKAKEQGQKALDAVSTGGQKEQNQQQRREEQAQKDRQKAAEEAEKAKQTVVGTIQQTAQEGLQAASDLLQGISGSASQQAGQADAEARTLAQHH